ncbi:hypothetical protein LIER_34821 [Lithospermum erythrorhizon]|uniref:Uncharacterized protein n=1 Tax=Lithospermum erythrorhizon TaxID=34254 RepID=A0AAV3S0N8_LITER
MTVYFALNITRHWTYVLHKSKGVCRRHNLDQDKNLGSHVVFLVGYDVLDSVPYYEVLNSWGPRYSGTPFLRVHQDLFTELYMLNDVTMVDVPKIRDGTMFDSSIDLRNTAKGFSKSENSSRGSSQRKEGEGRGSGSGSGKTAAFTVPMIQHCLAQPPVRRGDGPLALILAPTRELAQQIEKEAS